MDYCDRLARVLFEEGVRAARARDIKANRRFVDLYKDCPYEMMSLMRHIIRGSRVLTMMRDAGHAMADTSDEGGNHDDEGGDHDHDDESGDHDHDEGGGDHDSYGSNTPSNHDH